MTEGRNEWWFTHTWDWQVLLKQGRTHGEELAVFEQWFKDNEALAATVFTFAEYVSYDAEQMPTRSESEIIQKLGWGRTHPVKALEYIRWDLDTDDLGGELMQLRRVSTITVKWTFQDSDAAMLFKLAMHNHLKG